MTINRTIKMIPIFGTANITRYVHNDPANITPKIFLHIQMYIPNNMYKETNS